MPRGIIRTTGDLQAYISGNSVVADIRPTGLECFGMALTTAMSTTLDHPNRKMILKALRAKGQQRLRSLGIRMLLPRHRDEFGKASVVVPIDDIYLYENHYNVNIQVREYPTHKLIHVGQDRHPMSVCLVYIRHSLVTTDRHGTYLAITGNKRGYFDGKSHWCFTCDSAYDFTDHKCISNCHACHSSTCNSIKSRAPTFNIECSLCHISFHDSECYQHHLDKKACKRDQYCKACDETYHVIKKAPHVCGQSHCQNCKQYFIEDHDCFIQTVKVDEAADSKERFYIYYDIEVMQGNTLEGRSSHIFAGLIAIYGDSDTIFRFETIDAFMTWLCVKKHANYTLIAHNAAGYDVHFIKSYFIKRRVSTRDIVMGSRIISMVVIDGAVKSMYKGLRFIDSMRFISGGLRNFPKMFSLEAVKTYFPYRFFTVANARYIGPLPDKTWFDNSGEEFDLWYDNMLTKEIYDIYKECMDYCVLDVQVLKGGCEIFRMSFMEITGGLDPFRKTTIASACWNFFRMKCMTPDTLAVLKKPDANEGLYEYHEYQKLLFPTIESSIIRGHHVSLTSLALFVYAECLDTGCDTCTKKHSIHPIKGRFMMMLYKDFKKDCDYFRTVCARVIVMKACQWYSLKCTDPMVMAFMATYVSPITPLNIRDAFYGGRTEPIKAICEPDPSEPDRRMAYDDIQSLYPAIGMGQTWGITADSYDTPVKWPLPVGHPTHILKDFGPLSDYFGFVKCTIAPPPLERQSDVHPVLPYRVNGKLHFGFYTMTGTWFIAEVLKALEVGYRMKEIHFIDQFESSTTVFSEYFKATYPAKLKAGGFERLKIFEESEKLAYLHRHPELTYASMSRPMNVGLYNVVKIMQNSLWGKTGQKDNFSTTLDTYTEDAFRDVIHSDTHIVESVIMYEGEGEGVRTVQYKTRSAYLGRPFTTNVAYAAATTSQARLLLYSHMEKIHPRDLCYSDTDSLIYKDRGQLHYSVEVGDFIGELDVGEYITHFVSGGAKCYSYKTNLGRVVVKNKGTDISNRIHDTLDYDSMRYLVLNPEKSLTLGALKIQSDGFHNLYTYPDFVKRVRSTLDKREFDTAIVNGELNSRPLRY